MDLSAELKELRKQLYTYRYKSLELERQLRTHCHALHRSFDSFDSEIDGESSSAPRINAFELVTASFIQVFSNSLIMEMITSHLPVQDLLSCRLVCKAWSREMAQYVTKRKALVVAYEDCSEAREMLRKKQAGKFVNISTLCVLEIPVTSQIIVDVLKVFGETLSGLKLDDCKPEPEELFALLSAIPCLEVLSFKQTGVRRPNPDQEVLSRLDGLIAFHETLCLTSLKKLVWEEIRPVKYFERIIKMFPCLEELEILCPLKPNVERMRGMTLDTLKQLTITCDAQFTEEHFRALANLNLKLTKLTLHDIKPDGRRKMKGLKAFLESVSSTINELILEGMGRAAEEVNPKEFVYMNTPFPIDFPNLQKLEIDCSLMSNLKLLSHIPKLQKFECKFYDWKGWWHLLNQSGDLQPHTKIRQVSLGAIDSGCLLKISKCFASVTKLDISEDRVDDIAFRIICSNMRELSHIRITASTYEKNKKLLLTDYGITGILAEDCVKLNNLESVKGKKELGALRKHPYIGDLKSLYSLELACSELPLTDVAVLYGIGELRRISTITLPKCNLTDKSLTALGKLPALLVLELHKSCGVSLEGVSALRERKQDLVFNLYADLSTRIFA